MPAAKLLSRAENLGIDMNRDRIPCLLHPKNGNHLKLDMKGQVGQVTYKLSMQGRRPMGISWTGSSPMKLMNVSIYSCGDTSRAALVRIALRHPLALAWNLLILRKRLGIYGRELLVHKTFQGTLIEETRCLRCENIARRNDVLESSLDIEEDTSITCCLKNYCLTKLDRSNSIHCDQCKSITFTKMVCTECGIEDAQRRKTMKKPPRILVLHFKRFKLTTICFKSDLTRPNQNPSRCFNFKKRSYQVAYPLEPKVTNAIEDALYFDDEEVTIIDESIIHTCFGSQEGPSVAENEFILFYLRAAG
ncbi:hypothetical protein Droror1_Dr00025517 [Drosera rotundifolia]